MKQLYKNHSEQVSLITAVGGLLSALIACTACVGPLLGIALGIGGLGWLSVYSFISVPASFVSIVLMFAATYLFFNAKTCCANRRKHQINRWLMGTAAAAVMAINVLEHVIIPNVG